MPEPTYSPPADEAGAIISPRQLNRWIDVNPIAKLTRTRGYFTMPAFSVTATWRDYSDIVAAFNFTATNNFTLLTVDVPVSANYFLCIMWHENGTVHRYSLWEDVGEVTYFYIPPYAGQKIAKNFRLEIWSMAATASQATAITMLTSVLGVYDYMYADDFVVATQPGIITAFASPTMPTTPPPQIMAAVPIVFPSTSSPLTN